MNKRQAEEVKVLLDRRVPPTVQQDQILISDGRGGYKNVDPVFTPSLGWLFLSTGKMVVL